ncbi:hypothetical protein FNH05_23130 [Amycolatopsis rhizosphaerae]|uniref:SHOCT domain-containing protein n=1 Tax=Amycolatopsis rhizosphaerae TaxID=2053003 RepID=A0A558BWQ3_9PSEU|nr:SHOCT domain-containing protein [Amycolatopsis rhizosphaerae]TVT40956.1 hypothetical protein FNH05_23130 [Amycolatopsis rhizosphaerae]
MVLAQTTGSQYPFLELVWTMLVFFGWVIWFWLLIMVFRDLFRRHDISGWGKAGWTLLVLVLPFLGVLIYLIAQGRQMGERNIKEARSAQAQFDEYVRSVSKSGERPTEQIAHAKQLLDSGAITNEEYEALKRKVLTH